jgi:hypothetical protein
MKIVLKDIPSSALFYNFMEDELCTVFLEIEDGCVKEPVTCCFQKNNEEIESVDKYYEELLPYIEEEKIKRILIESMIIDTKITINHYKDKINKSSPEELELKLGEPDPSKWWTMFYPTRFEIFHEHICDEEKALRKYEKMLIALSDRE